MIQTLMLDGQKLPSVDLSMTDSNKFRFDFMDRRRDEGKIAERKEKKWGVSREGLRRI